MRASDRRPSRTPLGAKGSKSRGPVSEIQRARMIAATIDLIDEVGYPAITVAKIINRAHVSRVTFYDVFANRDECFLVVFDETLSRAVASAANAYADAPSWRQGVRAAVGGLLRLMEEHRTLAKLWVVETPRGEEKVLDRRVRVLDVLAEVIDEGRETMNGRHQPPDSVAEGIVGGIVAMLHRRLHAGGEAPLTDLLGPMMYLIVLPYLGAREARTELHRTTVVRQRTSMRASTNADPLEGLKMRLTYRTVRVLNTISRYPGASNRKVAESSGITDQGQISKLLGRLARLELIENHGEGQQKGGANAWQLTERGARIARLMRSSIDAPA